MDWWRRIDESVEWQEHIFLGLAIAYAVIALIALVQLIRIELRVPEYGWTTQKVFHLLNFIVNGVRALFSASVKMFRDFLQIYCSMFFWTYQAYCSSPHILS
jgi:hypothetical protein